MSGMEKTRHAHSALIEGIGIKVVRRAYGLTPARLYNWRQRGIPHSHRVAIARLASVNGIAVPADFFEGMAR